MKRFETLSTHKDVVEQVKAEARENEDIPTRSRVIQLVNEKKKQEELEQQNYETYCDYVDDCHKAFKKYFEATHKITEFEISDEFMDKATELFQGDDWNREIRSLQFAIQQMNIVLNYLINKPKMKGVKKL